MAPLIGPSLEPRLSCPPTRLRSPRCRGPRSHGEHQPKPIHPDSWEVPTAGLSIRSTTKSISFYSLPIYRLLINSIEIFKYKYKYKYIYIYVYIGLYTKSLQKSWLYGNQWQGLPISSIIYIYIYLCRVMALY